MHRTHLIVLACLVGISAWAQDLPELKEVVVTATRVGSDIIDSPSFITVITQKDIADSGARDFAGVLASQSGIVINDNGPAGATQMASIRGSTAAQVLVLLDGMRLNSSRDGAVDLSAIPLNVIDRVEIVRGGESSLYGTGAMGGVINIITRTSATPAITVSLTNGSFLPHDAYVVTGSGQIFTPADPMELLDSQNAAFSVAGKLGEAGLSAGGAFTRAANGFTWNDTSAGGINAWRVRSNARDMSGNGYLGTDVPLLGGILSAKGLFWVSNVGVPGPLSYPSSSAVQNDAAASAMLNYSTGRFFTDALTLDLKGFYRYDQLSYDDPSFPPPSLHKTQSASVDVTQRFLATSWLSAVYGGSASYDFADSTNIAGPKDRLNLAGFLAMPVIFFDSLTITPSVRYDFYSDFPGYLSYKIGAVLLLSDQSSLKANFGSAYRAPTLNELYWTDLYGDVGNPNLKPETSYSGEVGWSFEGKNLSVDASLFTRMVFDQIEWSYTAFTATPVNFGQTLMPGAELRARARVSDRFSLEASYTFIYSLLLQYAGKTYQLSDNLRVSSVPLHNVDARLGYTDSRNAAGIGLQYVSTVYTDAANTEAGALAGHLVLNADYKLSLSNGLAFSLVLRNLLNSVYQTALGYPMPPFSIETGVSARL